MSMFLAIGVGASLLVGAYALFDLKSERPSVGADAELPVPGGATL